MLKDKGYTKNSLYSRIDEAVSAQVLTPGMAEWAHQIRLDSNDQRHADEVAKEPTVADAKRCIEFAKTIGELLYVLPDKVNRGISNSQSATKKASQPIKPVKKLKLPPANRSAKYMHRLILGRNDDRPTAKVTLHFSPHGHLTSNQPPDLIVTQRPGMPGHWQTDLILESCSGLPNLSYVKVFVDGELWGESQLQVH